MGGQSVTLTNHPILEMDDQSVHFGSECHSRKFLQGRSVTLVNCHSGRNILWIFVRAEMSHGLLVGGHNIKAPSYFYQDPIHSV